MAKPGVVYSAVAILKDEQGQAFASTPVFQSEEDLDYCLALIKAEAAGAEIVDETQTGGQKIVPETRDP